MSKKWAIVTGASSGIGKEFCYQLAGEYNLVLIARSEGKLIELKNEFEHHHLNQCLVLPLDLSQTDSARECLQFIQKHELKIQMLVNNAGLGHHSLFVEEEFATFQNMIHLNITALTELTHLFGQHMLAHGLESFIINVASTASFIQVPKYSVYCATKFYVRQLSEIIAYELRDTNISVSCVCPGATDTSFMQNMGKEVPQNKQWALMSPKEVVKEALTKTSQKKTTIVTGNLNKFQIILNRFVPKKLMMSLSGKVIDSSLK
ncbi:MAG: hypothetical protein CME62_07225 [Halobacteriovoraceae bacterium]|nr:hypothetical protein [Halobacteriovoraceae bacterium]|tara:strand:+ start:17819 stop:18604 length:786 start_codon:yes stop_codon:yes gene_type:complete